MGRNGRAKVLSTAVVLAGVLAACGPATPPGPAVPASQQPGGTSAPATSSAAAVPGSAAETPAGTPEAPGGTAPAGTPEAPAATAPGGTLPGGTLPGGTLPGSTVPGGTALPGTTTPGTATPGSPLDPSADPGTPSSDWHTFTTSDGQLSFDYPPAWTVKDPASDAALGGEFVDVVNAGGKSMAALRTNVVTGAQCLDKYPYEILDSEPMQALAEPGTADHNVPRYVFETRGDNTARELSPPTLAAYGITLMPEETGPTACPMFHLFLWPPSGALFGQTYNPENNATPADASLPYLAKAKLYASTPEYRDIRKMITSLRPAGK